MALANILLGLVGVSLFLGGAAGVIVVFGPHSMATNYSEPGWTDFLPSAVAIGIGLAFILIGF
jgi:hypothetical protein